MERPSAVRKRYRRAELDEDPQLLIPNDDDGG